jgi:hypothetical protein
MVGSEGVLNPPPGGTGMEEGLDHRLTDVALNLDSKERGRSILRAFVIDVECAVCSGRCRHGFSGESWAMHLSFSRGIPTAAICASDPSNPYLHWT